MMIQKKKIFFLAWQSQVDAQRKVDYCNFFTFSFWIGNFFCKLQHSGLKWYPSSPLNDWKLASNKGSYCITFIAPKSSTEFLNFWFSLFTLIKLTFWNVIVYSTWIFTRLGVAKIFINKTNVINDPLRQTHSSVSSDHYFLWKLFCFVRFWKVWTIRVKIIIMDRPSGSILGIQWKYSLSFWLDEIELLKYFDTEINQGRHSFALVWV